MAIEQKSRGEIDKERGIVRISFTTNDKLKQDIRICAAFSNMTEGQWATKVLELAAERVVGPMRAAQAAAEKQTRTRTRRPKT